MIFLITLMSSVLLTIASIPVLGQAAIHLNAVDLPNERKVHTRPIPRIGGVGMALGVFAPLLYSFRDSDFLVAYLAGGAVLVLFGMLDDFLDLSPAVKCAGQLLAALIAVLYGGVTIKSLGVLLPDGMLLPSWVAVPLTLFAMVGVTNAINLADGLDGLAGGISLLIFSGIGYLAYLDGNQTVALITLALGGALFGFLRYNTHPASVFMGDAGSQFLGFSAITLSLALTQGHPTAVSPVLPLILLGFPILDTLTVMVTRVRRGRSPFSADRNHFHHNLLAAGFRHPESVLIIYCFQTFLLCCAVLLRFHSDWTLLAGYLLFCVTVLAVFHFGARRHWRVPRPELIEVQVVERLVRWRREGTVIVPVFRFFETGVPLLLFVTCFFARRAPFYFSACCLLCAGLLGAVLLLRKELLAGLLRCVLYLLIPFAVYLGNDSMQGAQTLPAALYNAAFGVVAVGMVLVTKFSRRSMGFHGSPMDFLIAALALLMPNVLALDLQKHHLGVIAGRIIILYFSYEVLQAELRGRMDRLALATVASLLVLAL